MSSFSPNTKHVAAMGILLLISVAINVSLANRVGSVAAKSSGRPVDVRPAQGDRLSLLEAKTLDGQGTAINVADAKLPTIFYMFTPQCGWCARNRDNIDTLIREVEGRYRVVAISLTSKDLSSYLVSHPMNVPVFMEPTEASIAAYVIGATPQTIVVSPSSVVTHVWRGAYTGRVKNEIERALDVQLPGLPAQ